MSFDEYRWRFYDRPGLLIGPLPHVRGFYGGWVQDYSHPGVAERIAAEVDYVVDMDKQGGRR
jgi:hypothetical protein